MVKSRLQKIIAQATSLSRRSAEEAIKKGLVKLNGAVVTKLGTKADPDRDKITLSGKSVRPVSHYIYIIFNKPRNTIVSKNDPEGRPTIWDRMQKDMKDVLNSAGRLDFDSEGLIILTNDGRLIYKLTHPSVEIWKTYHVKLNGIPKAEDIDKLTKGIKLDDGVTLPAKIKPLRKTENNATYEISIREGKNRQVRRMFLKIGCPVSKLRRMEVGDIKLGLLKPGEWRYFNKKEYLFIKKLLA